MANQEHIKILKQGVQAWNRWRREHPEIQPDLGRMYLRDAILQGFYIPGDTIMQLRFEDIDLSLTNFREAYLDGCIFSQVKFNGAFFYGAHLSGLVLRDVDFSGAHLTHAVFENSDLKNVNFNHTSMGWTIFGNVNLSEAKGLETVTHHGPSTIDLDTIYHSQGHIPEDFLRKAGVPDSFIKYMHSLVVKPIDYYTCFISYSNKDEAFARRLYADLQSNHVRCWFAPEDMKIGDNIHTRVDESIHLYDKLLLVLSEHSLTSTWVEREVAAALEKEQQQGQRVLFPIRLDESVMQTSQAWAADIRRRKHIGDFIRWKQHDNYQQALERLLRDLQAEA